MTSPNDNQNTPKKRHPFWTFIIIMLVLFAITEQIYLFREGKSIFSPYIHLYFLKNSSTTEQAKTKSVVQAKKYGYTSMKKVNVRSEARTNSSKVTRIEDKGTKIEIIDSKRNEKNELWYHVRLSNGTTGYIIEDYVSLE